MMFESSQPADSPQMELPLMSSAEDSPVRTFPSQERELAWQASAAAYGRSSPVLLASYDPDTRSWKTSQLCLVEGLQTFSETWPRSGMMRSGIAYRLPQLVRLTDATAFGLLPTPHGAGGGGSSRGGDRYGEIPTLQGMARAGLWPTPISADAGEGRGAPLKYKGGNLSLTGAVRLLPTPSAVSYGTNQGGGMGRVGPVRPSLQTMARKGLWPTPRAMDGEKGARTATPYVLARGETGLANLAEAVQRWPTPVSSDATGGPRIANSKRGPVPGLNAAVKMWPTPKSSPSGPDYARMGRPNSGGDDLATVVARASWPTPTAQDASNNGGDSQYERNSLPLNAVIGGALNPTWVEWLQGFPLGWTEVD
jgi:hypothetical protein